MKRKSFSREMLSESEDSTHEDRLVGQHLTDIGSQTSYMALLCVDRQPKRANQRCQVDARQKGGSKVKAAAVAASNAAKVNAARRSDLMPILFRRNVVTFGLLCVMHFTFCAVLCCSARDRICSVLFYSRSFLFC